MNKIIYLFSFLVFLHTSKLFGAAVIPLAENEDFIFRASSSLGDISTYQQMFMEDPSSGGGASESDPFVVYIPIDTDDASPFDQAEYSILTTSATMPNVLATVPGIHFKFYAEITNFTSETIQAAAFDGTDYKDFTITPASLGNDQYLISVDFDLMCDEIGTNCSSFLSTTDGARESDFTFFIYASTTNATPGTTINTSSVDGVFYKINLSDKIPSGVITTTSMTIGDENLTLNFTGGDTITEMDDTIIYRLLMYDFATGTADTTNSPIQTASAGISGIYSYETPNRAGSVTAQKLTNGTTYNFGLALVNKYLFASKLSNSIVGVPIEIETLLKENQCYLVTAGFQKEHYILDYFRHIRDSLLLKSSWGSKFVEFYYSTAPDYAPVVYNSKWLSAIVRAASYTIFYIMKVYPILIFLALMIFVIRLKRKFLLNPP
jgi:hypothetical protein